MRKAKDIDTLIDTMEEAQKKARSLVTVAKEKIDVISNGLEEARREALNLIINITPRTRTTSLRLGTWPPTRTTDSRPSHRKAKAKQRRLTPSQR